MSFLIKLTSPRILSFVTLILAHDGAQHGKHGEGGHDAIHYFAFPGSSHAIAQTGADGGITNNTYMEKEQRERYPQFRQSSEVFQGYDFFLHTVTQQHGLETISAYSEHFSFCPPLSTIAAR
jgi:hypothetical protein